MMKRGSHLLAGFFLLVHFLSDAETVVSADRLDMSGGAVLVGQIESVGREFLRFKTDYAGILSVRLESIERVTLARPLDVSLPDRIQVFEVGVDAAAEKPPPARVEPREKPAPKPPLDWLVKAGLNLTGKSGNSERFDFTVNIDAELERRFDRIKLYGRYAYGTNRGVQSADEIIVGSRYTNFYYDGAGFFLRQEVEEDPFEGIAFRSTSAGGFSYQFENDEDLRIEARSGISYRYEDYTKDGSEDFPGMDIGLDIQWRFVRWARFKGSYTFLPSIDDFADYIFEQDSGINLPLNGEDFWKLRFGISTHYNNHPDGNREKLDTRYYARLIAAWK